MKYNFSQQIDQATVTHFVESFDGGTVYLDSDFGDLPSVMIFVDHINSCDTQLVLPYTLTGAPALVPFLFNGDISVLDSFSCLTLSLITASVDALTVQDKGTQANQMFNYVRRQNKMIKELLFDAGCTPKELKEFDVKHCVTFDKKRLEELLQLCKEIK